MLVLSVTSAIGGSGMHFSVSNGSSRTGRRSLTRTIPAGKTPLLSAFPFEFCVCPEPVLVN